MKCLTFVHHIAYNKSVYFFLRASHTVINYALPGNKTDKGTVARQTSINKVKAAPGQLIHNWNRST